MARTLDLTGWTPARLAWTADEPLEWVFTGSLRFTEPFFEQTLTLALKDPFALFFRHRTDTAVLLEEARARPGLSPSGFVFHLSRCGSTLVTQMLARSPRFRALSEPGAVDAVVRAPLPHDEKVELLRAIVSVLGRPLAGEEQLVVKLDSWNALDLALVEEAFPDTPWIFLFRRPDEVLASQLGHAGVHGVPGALPPELFGLTLEEALALPREEYLARVLAAICEAALAHAGSPNGCFVDYRRLPEYVLDGLPEHFGFELSAAERASMGEAARLDAKNPALPFKPPADRGLNAEAAAVCERLLEPLYRRLAAC